MPILAICPNCQQSYHVGEQFAGKKAKCQACGKPFQVPVPEVDPLGDAAALASALPSLAAPEYVAAAPLPSSNPLGAGGYAAHSPYAASQHRHSSGSGVSLSAGEPVEWALRPGFTCSVLGVGGFLLPLIGVQFKILAFLGTAAPIVAGLLAAAGAVLLFLGLRDNLIKALGASAAVIVLAGGAFVLSATVAAIEHEQGQDLGQPIQRPQGPPLVNPVPGMAGMPGGLAAPVPAAANPAAAPVPASGAPGQPQVFQEPAPSPASQLRPLELAPPTMALPALARTEDVGVNGELSGREADFADHAPEGGWLVGLRVIQSPNWGGAILGIQPIYQVEDKYVPGSILCGTSEVRGETILLARPGFAISGLHYHAGLVMNSLQLEFRQVRGSQLVAEGAYISERIGCNGGSPKPAMHGKGEPIRGIDGTAKEDLTSLRLYHVNAPTKLQ
jgi:hypothetical protein